MKLPAHLALTTFASILAAQASVIDFDFNAEANGQSTFSETRSGVTITLSDPSPVNFSADTAGPGLYFDGNGVAGPNAFTMSFSSAVQFTGYTVSFNDAGSFSLSRTGASSTGNAFDTVGFHSLNGTFTAAANEPILFTSTGGTTNGFQFSHFFVDASAPVPEPGETAAATAILCGATALALRQRGNK